MNLASLEDVVTAATTVSDAATLSMALKAFLKRDVAEPTLASMLANDQDPLALLNPLENTIGYLFILTARLEQSGSGPGLTAQIFSFVEGCSTNLLAWVPERVNTFVSRLLRQPNVREMLEALAIFVQRYPHSRDVFTAVHTVFLQACVRYRVYQVALPVLNNRVAQIDKSIYPITYLDNLLYHYYGAFAFIALKQWADAEEFLEMVVAAPISSNIPSAIQMEAMKKLSLVHLIRYGTIRSLPKYIPPLFAKAIKQSSYGQFAKVYPAGQVQQVAEKEAKTFHADFNIGLVKEAIDMAPRWKLRTLTKTYLTLSLAEIGKEIDMADETILRSLVENMIQIGEISATLEGDTLTFIDEKPNFRPGDIEKALADAQEQCQKLAKLDQAVGRSREFLQKALKDRDTGGGGGWAAAGDEEMLWAEEISAQQAYL
ncbi:hypothetical protein M408DRAFT_331937 [Serendipita vermifera MAFF 305830]|uniref:COP9 signalosome complex subunit 3 n=1 Tax=Serendipita vermifera MAFF 305830 TaxID=933852 RepID=A0A0C2WCK9_SERVB|nr:hypothetical protein M408DRAFT_331937 [Serendipita vermifera MAFF 305830]